MRPSVSPTSQQELTTVWDTLLRASERTEPTDRGPVIAVCLFLWLSSWLIGLGWHSMLAYAVPSDRVNLDPKLRAVMQAEQEFYNHKIRLPDGRIVHWSRYERIESRANLPKTGNKIGDLYWVKGDHYWIWESQKPDVQATWNQEQAG
jgi:hypothetical protein